MSKPTSQLKYSKTERRKRFNPRKWAQKWTNDVIPKSHYDHVGIDSKAWDPNDYVTCTSCGGSQNKSHYPDVKEFSDKWLCEYCDWSVPVKGVKLQAEHSLKIAGTYYLSGQIVKLKNFHGNGAGGLNGKGDCYLPGGGLLIGVDLSKLEKVIAYSEFDNSVMARMCKWLQSKTKSWNVSSAGK